MSKQRDNRPSLIEVIGANIFMWPIIFISYHITMFLVDTFDLSNREGFIVAVVIVLSICASIIWISLSLIHKMTP
jgi:hypothetical protein